MLRSAKVALLPFVLVAVARELEAALGLVLHTGLRDPDLLRSALAVLAADPVGCAARVGAWTLAGLFVWGVLAKWRSASDGLSFRVAAVREASTFAPLWLLPATTLLSLFALAARATWPYGHTLAVALTQDLSLGRDALVVAALVARRVPALRIPAPRGGAVFFVSFLAYALLTPEWARHWDNHPGNEPKYLRLAVALGHRLSLDVEPVSASMEELEPLPLATAVASAAHGLLRESTAMLKALLQGPRGVGREAIRATRITRQTIGGKDGGVYHVLAPGPSLLLAPTLRIDRALNLRFKTPGRLAISVLLVNALGALLVLAVFQLARDATGRAGLAAAVAFAMALLPPFLFYFFQFYPEMPGALVLAVLFRLLFLNERFRVSQAWGAGLLLASLPWLHQKFLPVWLVLAATAVVAAWRRGSSGSSEPSEPNPRRLLLTALLLPQAASLYLTALYNFGIAGSVRPDALFLAWGPAGVTTARLGQGLVGLWLDARYGLLPLVPVYALGFAGLFLKTEGRARLLRAVPAAFVYFVTVAAADNWAGAVCNLGRYLMPILPLVIAFAAIALDRTVARRGVLAVVLVLFAVSGLFAWALWLDPHAANDSAVLFAKSRFVDAFAYVPGLFIRTWAAGAAGLFVRIALWALLVAGLVIWLRRVATACMGEASGEGPRDAARPGAEPLRAVVAMLCLVLVLAALLERWPSRREGPAFGLSVSLADGQAVFLEGPVRSRDDVFELDPGSTRFVVRSAGAPRSLAVLAGGTGLLERLGSAPVALRRQGVLLHLPLEPAAVVTGKDGARETLSTLVLRVTGAPTALRFRGRDAPASAASPETVEPPPSGER